MEIKVFGSSSEGNCYLIDDGSSQLLLECGVSVKNLLQRGIKLPLIAGCLITHEHKDHAKYLNEFGKFIPMIASKGTFDSFTRVPVRRIVVKDKDCILVGSYKIIPFEVQHDAVEPLGYFIHSNKTNENLLFATDTYFIKNRFNNINYLMIECNYSREILDAKLKENESIIPVAKRLMSSHFSLENVIEFIKANDMKHCKEIMLLHLSDSNSNEDLFKQKIQQLTGIPVKVAKKYGD